jgi:hypothetical protein
LGVEKPMTVMTRTKLVLMFVATWLLLAAFILVQRLPWVPRTPLEWLLFIGFGPPLYLIGEALFSWLLSSGSGYRISTRMFSALRMLFAPLCGVLFLGLAWYLSSLLGVGA